MITLIVLDNGDERTVVAAADYDRALADVDVLRRYNVPSFISSVHNDKELEKFKKAQLETFGQLRFRLRDMRPKCEHEWEEYAHHRKDHPKLHRVICICRECYAVHEFAVPEEVPTPLYRWNSKLPEYEMTGGRQQQEAKEE